MNTQSAFDKFIADKLVELPVPDLAKNIWQQIHTQLHQNIPNDTAKKISTPAQSYKMSEWVIIITTVVVVIGLIILNQKKKGPAYKPLKKSIPFHQYDFPKTDSMTIKHSIKKNSTTPIIDLKTKTMQADTLDYRPAPLQALPDSISTEIKNEKVPVRLPAIDSLKRKPKGVKGISDSDYQIMIKNDSLQ